MIFSFHFRCRRLPAVLCTTMLLAGCAAELHHHDGMFALEQQDYPKAVAELSQASAMKPQDLAYRSDWLRARETATAKLQGIANAAFAAGKVGEAEQAYKQILEYERDNARALAGLESLRLKARANTDAAQARQVLKQGDLNLAAELAARALANAPEQAEAKAVLQEVEAAKAQETLATPTLGSVYKKPINLEFRDASIKMVFDALSRTTGINFIFDRDVKGDQRTTVFLKQTTLDDAIDVILSTGQLEKKVLNSSSVLIYPNTPAKLREYQDLMVRAFYLSNVEAKQAANMLKTVLKIKDVYVDDKYNMLVLRESAETIGLAERLIALQDLEEPEVMLEVEVIEINRSRLLNLGIQWTDQLSFSPLGGTPSSSGNGSGSGSGSGGVATGTSTMKLSDLKSINSSTIGVTVPSVTLNFDKTDGDANLLANPRIRVRDREKAKILIGDKVPVVTTTTTNTFVTENIQYLDVGLKLEVEPDIHLRDEVGLKLNMEVSSLVSSIKTNNGSQAYQIGTRNFSSALRLKDGETQVLAGLINDNERSSASHIPLLGDLPVLGRLFGSQNDNNQKTEIVLSITPHLVRNIQRKGALAESFWSGTEARLYNKPLMLRNFDNASGNTSKTPGPAGSPAARAPADNPVSAPTSPNAPKLNWEGAEHAKVGEIVTFHLNMDSPDLLRALSLQLAFNPAELEVQSVKEGDYFSRAGKSNFNHAIDNASGRISVGMGGSDDLGAKGAGRVVTVTAKLRAPADSAGISVIALTPIGAKSAVGRPGLPVAHRLVGEQ